MRFDRTTLPQRVVFGQGRIAELEGELKSLGADAAVVIASERALTTVKEAVDGCGPMVASTFTALRQHVPADVVAQATAHCQRVDADAVISVGGGSAIGLGKAISRELGLPTVAVPTTYSGSEITPIYGITTAGTKRTGVDPAVLPDIVIYDPELTLALKDSIVGSSGMNALAHALWAYPSRTTDPVTRLVAGEAVQRLLGGLHSTMAGQRDVDVRAELLYGAYLAGTVLAHAGTAYHHRICHHLGGALGLPHAETHAALLPHTVHLLAAADPAAHRSLAELTGTDLPESVLFDVLAALVGSHDLAQYGLTPATVEAAADVLADSALPEGVRRGDLASMLAAAAAGERSW